MYHHTKNEVSRSSALNVTAWTDRQTHTHTGNTKTLPTFIRRRQQVISNSFELNAVIVLFLGFENKMSSWLLFNLQAALLHSMQQNGGDQLSKVLWQVWVKQVAAVSYIFNLEGNQLWGTWKVLILREERSIISTCETLEPFNLYSKRNISQIIFQIYHEFCIRIFRN